MHLVLSDMADPLPPKSLEELRSNVQRQLLDQEREMQLVQPFRDQLREQRQQSSLAQRRRLEQDGQNGQAQSQRLMLPAVRANGQLIDLQERDVGGL